MFSSHLSFPHIWKVNWYNFLVPYIRTTCPLTASKPSISDFPTEKIQTHSSLNNISAGCIVCIATLLLHFPVKSSRYIFTHFRYTHPPLNVIASGFNNLSLFLHISHAPSYIPAYSMIRQHRILWKSGHLQEAFQKSILFESTCN